MIGLLLPLLLLAQPGSGLPDDVVLPGDSPTPPLENVTDPSRFRAISVVVVDPGHGGDDLGARDLVRGAMEKDLTLLIAKKVEASFATYAIGTGARLLLTRDGDVRAATASRTSLANEARADLFVSIHVNASPSPKTRGFQVAYHDGAGADVALARPRDPHAGPLPAQPWIAAQKSREEDSARFAEIVRESLAAKVALPDRGVKRLPLSVLEGATCPAVLIEVGYLSNDQEALALSTGAVQDAVADAIAEAVLRMDAVIAARNPER